MCLFARLGAYFGRSPRRIARPSHWPRSLMNFMSNHESWKIDLINRHPRILGHMTTERGIECGPGWRDLLDVLCLSLEALSAPDGPQVAAVIIKEKLGTLRVQVLNASPAQRGAIDLAGRLSSRICETCGSPSIASTNEGGAWRPSRCRAHFDEPTARS